MNDAIYLKDITGLSSDVTLFTSIQALKTLFDGATTDDLQLCAEEYYMHSSEKKISPLFRKWVNDAIDLTALIAKVSKALIVRYGENWRLVWNAYFMTSYKPLENYAMKEEKTPRVETTIDVNTGTNVTNTQKSKVYGFNSESPVNDSESEVTTEGEKAQNETTSKTSFTGKDTLERTGNIGVTTSQQMLTSEIELRKYDYWEMVYSDIDRMLCFIFEAC